ncbi:MAG: peptidase T, partial [Candidatus Bipolaricaulota bacterium]|nr:peptidase T [Candidatus Bipolaricaulota bacterium]
GKISMTQQYLQELEERFLRYVKIDTQSDETSNEAPSTERQLALLRLLKQELDEIGTSDARITDYGCLLATIPPTSPGSKLPTVALLAHADTAPALSGANVKPIIHRNYDGSPITLPDDPSKTLNEETAPGLSEKHGEDIVTAGGTTLLGADDKAGVAVIMTLASHLLSHPEISHGKIRLCFTPDEEIGRGVDHLTLEDLAADVAYTIDGGALGEVVYESFSADKAVVEITGVSIHPGTAKGKMVNALKLAAQFIEALPQQTRTPETTDGREGFIHPYRISGTAAHVELLFILRDFELDGLKAHGDLIRSVVERLAIAEPRAKIECTITPQYRNMRYWIENEMRPVEVAIEAIKETGIEPIITPIRGGTDGARLTEMGLPTPNLFAGMHNVHGPLEWVSLHDMAKATQVCLNLVCLLAQEPQISD